MLILVSMLTHRQTVTHNRDQNLMTLAYQPALSRGADPAHHLLVEIFAEAHILGGQRRSQLALLRQPALQLELRRRQLIDVLLQPAKVLPAPAGRLRRSIVHGRVCV